ncbi:hypothetical protein PPERSA_11303 [Pseudocohnilembus persalinus]|uniref:RAP domain-containing protein n=1 Tax=Pseudocohnilembus persalinus TaxID=266149 RepID=A0A0V0QP73_PSEPJ|nr:hypothetical protein PPERSA_11303 [Pseudocohnilembus persalinus]|eukprot:KRX04179.1 hypothetical protein PPERSA_11303 [Pseudocohnilembus persalinus]
MIFWCQALLNRENQLQNFLQNNKELIYKATQKAANSNVQFTMNKLFKKNLSGELLDIHLNQIQESLYFITRRTQINTNEYLEQIELIEQNQYYIDRKNTRRPQKKVLSYFQQQTNFLIENIMKQQNLDYQLIQEYTDEAPFSVDFLLKIFKQPKDIKIIIECNGKQHYINGYLKYNHLIKAEILKQQGYKVLQIHIDDWNNLKKAQQQSYIESQIKNIIKEF